MTYQPPHIARLQIDHPLSGGGVVALAPKTPNDVASILRHASEKSFNVQVVGGGTHSGFGDPEPADIVMSMERLSRIEAWEADDLTAVIEAGATVASVEDQLNDRNQSLVLLEHPGKSTVGGAISSGLSSLRRGRLYATRERLLEATVVTGDGRIVRSGGRVVKNVTGYDLHRLVVGAFGSMGVVVSVCMKLWPTPPAAMTVTVEDLESASAVVRPLAVVEVDGAIQVFLSGTEAEVESQATRLGGQAAVGHDWPHDPSDVWKWSLRVPPAHVSGAIDRLPESWSYLALHGVGELRCASPDLEGAAQVREWAERASGTLVMTTGDSNQFDPWGAAPAGVEIQRQLIAQFDPARVINRGRMPGGL